MSQIDFIRTQGDLMDAAIATAPAPRPATLLSRARSLVQPHKRLTIVLVALLVAGCAAAAATQLLGSSERLLLGRVDCYYATGLNHAVASDATLISGLSPQAWCKQEFHGYSPADLREFGVIPMSNPRVIACRKNATTIAVLIASGKPDQCKLAGLAPLPQTFNAASASVHALARKLRAIYLSRDCWSVTAFTSALRGAFDQHGFESWRIVPPPAHEYVWHSPIGAAHCADFSTGSYVGNPYQALDGINRTLNLGFGISRSSMALVSSLGNKLVSEMWRRCYSRAGARALVDRSLAGTGLTPTFAITVNPNDPNDGPGFSFGSKADDRHFQQGCVILFLVWPALKGHTEYVWLMARHGSPLKQAQDPPASYFHS